MRLNGCKMSLKDETLHKTPVTSVCFPMLWVLNSSYSQLFQGSVTATLPETELSFVWNGPRAHRFKSTCIRVSNKSLK